MQLARGLAEDFIEKRIQHAAINFFLCRAVRVARHEVSVRICRFTLKRMMRMMRRSVHPPSTEGPIPRLSNKEHNWDHTERNDYDDDQQHQDILHKGV